MWIMPSLISKFVVPVFEQTGMSLTAEKIQLVLSAAKKGVINNFAVVNDISRLHPKVYHWIALSSICEG